MLKENDNEIYELIENEKIRQKNMLNMIPSENYCSNECLLALGSVLNNKYAEGYPKKRYYQGNEYIDKIEEIAINRAKKLFNAEHANVQVNSGSPANMAVYFGLLEVNDTILAMDLSHGGHLTHGSSVNFSGKLYNFIHYGVEEDSGLIDMKKVEELALKHKPKLIVCGFTAYPMKVDFKAFSEIAKKIDAITLADISHIAGLIAGGVHENPFPYIDVVTTTTHKTLRGPRSAIILCKEKYAKAIDKAVFPGLQGGPHEHVIAAKAVSFKEAMSDKFKEYAKQTIINAKILADYLIKNDINLVSNGTETHLILIDLIKTKFIGKIGLGKKYCLALEDAGIVTNANTVPFDPSTPFKPSGIRLGVPTLTSRGFKEKEMEKVGEWIVRVLKNPDDEEMKAKIKEEIKEFCKDYDF
ncbi:MAG: serine hydroxymethyltransferase [Candidatus Woesearchaeota archaeon]